jgi:uncharacterized protein
VGTKIIGAFAERLEELVLSDDAAGKEAAAVGATAEGEPAAQPDVAGQADADAAPEVAAGGEAQVSGAAAVGAPERRLIAPDPSREDDALDLMEVAGASAVKRLVPLALGAAVIGLIVWLIRRR